MFVRWQSRIRMHPHPVDDMGRGLRYLLDKRSGVAPAGPQIKIGNRYVAIRAKTAKPDVHLAAILVKSVRRNGKPTQQHVAYLGGITESQTEHLNPRWSFWDEVTRKLTQLNLPRKERRRIEDAVANGSHDRARNNTGELYAASTGWIRNPQTSKASEKRKIREPKHPPGPPMDLANMRQQGVHHLIAYCLNDLSPSGPDRRVELSGRHASPVVPSKVKCAKCGARGNRIDVRPNWKEKPGRSTTGPGGQQCRAANDASLARRLTSARRQTSRDRRGAGREVRDRGGREAVQHHARATVQARGDGDRDKAEIKKAAPGEGARPLQSLVYYLARAATNSSSSSRIRSCAAAEFFLEFPDTLVLLLHRIPARSISLAEAPAVRGFGEAMGGPTHWMLLEARRAAPADYARGCVLAIRPLFSLRYFP